MAAGRAWGQKLDTSLESLPADARSADEAIDQLVEVLDELGFAPERRTSKGEQQVGLRHCPFLELAETRASVVCPIHLGLMQGALETWAAPVLVDRLEAFVEPDLCLAHITPVGAAG
jgi:predicted ArsR family transcriptional regulator